MMSQFASGFSSANLRSFFSPMRKYLDASSMESVYFCQIGISFVFKYNTSCKLRVPFQRTVLQKIRGRKRMAAGTAPREFHPGPWLLAQLHGNFTPAHADGCGARCFAGVQCASIFDLSVCHRPQSAASALRPGVDRSLPEGKSWRTGRMARYRQNVSVCLMLRRRPPAGLSLSRSYNGTPRGKGNTQRPALDQLRSKSRMEIISFASSRPRRSSSTWGRGWPSGPSN